MITVVDDFLPQSQADEVCGYLMGERINWRFNDGIDYPQDGKYQFIHFFFMDHVWSEDANVMAPIVSRLNPVSICKIKSNLLLPTRSTEENQLHVDVKPSEPFTTAIYYANSCDGYTKFEDGTTVGSIANRLVMFPASMRHKGTTSTSRRVVVNFNYVAQES